jgi:CubicO group peptidase (beta-lactamase class C family)
VRQLVAWLTAGLLAMALPAVRADEIGPSYKSKIDSLVSPVIEAEDVVGMTIGVITGDGQSILGYGKLSQSDPRVPAADTLFEIGSITKTFSGLLLADLAEAKLVRLDEPVQKLLPDSVKVPKRGDAEITLLNLTTHTSGLPRMPGNWKPAKPTDPYADYTEKLLFEFLNEQAKSSLWRGLKAAFADPDAKPKYAYSNLGAGLLGHALALRAGKKSYEELLIERIAQPLRMNDTRISLSAEQLRRFSPGHNADGEPVGSWAWEHSSLAAAGGLRSSAGDMLRYLSANMGLTKTKLATAMQTSHQIHHKVGEHMSIGLGWHINTTDHFAWHNGRTGGYCSMALFDKEKKLGVVVLSNTVSDVVDLIAVACMRVLRDQELPPVPVRRPIKVDRRILEQYVGTYAMSPFVYLTITLQEGRLLAQLTGQDAFRIYPESETAFYYKVVRARITFEKDEKGTVTRLVLHQSGRDMPANRLPVKGTGKRKDQ